MDIDALGVGVSEGVVELVRVGELVGVDDSVMVSETTPEIRNP
jgi:hypothetical protein